MKRKKSMDKNYHILNTVHTINIWTLLPAGLSPHSCSELFLLWNMDKSIYLVHRCFPKHWQTLIRWFEGAIWPWSTLCDGWTLVGILRVKYRLYGNSFTVNNWKIVSHPSFDQSFTHLPAGIKVCCEIICVKSQRFSLWSHHVVMIKKWKYFFAI